MRFLTVITSLFVLDNALNVNGELETNGPGIKANWEEGLNGKESGYLKILAGQKTLETIRQKRSLRAHKKQVFENPICTPPRQFDSRTQWPECKSIGRVYDQSQCNSAWAIVPAAVLSDRLCIASNGKIQTELSAMDLLSCCKKCAIEDENTCEAGYTTEAWEYMHTEGLVTGGSYRNASGCLSYKFEPCDKQNTKECPTEKYNAPQCSQKCENKHPRTFKQDKFFAEEYYFLNNEKEIQCDILKNGPVQTSIDTFEDFYGYQDGIYKHKWGYTSGNQDVKLIGWGEENDVRYWIGINSWGKKWGNQGEFRILRGSNRMKIEEAAMSAKPDLSKSPKN